MSQYNKLSDIQYASFHILPVNLDFETVLVSWYPHHVECDKKLRLQGSHTWLSITFPDFSLTKLWFFLPNKQQNRIVYGLHHQYA